MIATVQDIACDLLVIGGGINGTGIARDAAGRGLSVVLCERDDLAQHTSSASTKLVHGGLRYLEYYEFGLVRKALREREVLLRLAPHIIWPLRFVMPHEASARPAWMIRAGLFLYDHLARRAFLPASRGIRLNEHEAGVPLKGERPCGFEYSDGWVDDARLVVLNALDAHERGARILTRTSCARVVRDSDGWLATLEGAQHYQVRARAVVNAAGPWAAQVAQLVSGQAKARALRLVKGSHIVVPRLFTHPYAYIIQNLDRRIVFAIPYQDHYTLIGTTDLEYKGDPAKVTIDEDEVDYLCRLTNAYFLKQISKADVVWTYSGVRPLLDDSAGEASAVTRDYLLDMPGDGPPLLHVYGGKITTYRKLAEEALGLLAPRLACTGSDWTAEEPLPGGDLEGAGELANGDAFAPFLARFRADHPWLPEALALRYARGYGSRAARMLGGASSLAQLGAELAPGLFECELRYLADVEWATDADDVLWRRTKLGLSCNSADVENVQRWLARHWRP